MASPTNVSPSPNQDGTLLEAGTNEVEIFEFNLGIRLDAEKLKRLKTHRKQRERLRILFADDSKNG